LESIGIGGPEKAVRLGLEALCAAVLCGMMLRVVGQVEVQWYILVEFLGSERSYLGCHVPVGTHGACYPNIHEKAYEDLVVV
jgi:hypothetical protein